jgi:hypothetical protein
MASTRTRRPSGQATSQRTVYDGQLNQDQLRALIKERGEQAAARRLAWMQAHPDWIACAVAGCSGLVSPPYQRTAPNGEKYGFCPRRTTHARIYPALFAPKATAA